MKSYIGAACLTYMWWEFLFSIKSANSLFLDWEIVEKWDKNKSYVEFIGMIYDAFTKYFYLSACKMWTSLDNIRWAVKLMLVRSDSNE